MMDPSSLKINDTSNIYDHQTGELYDDNDGPTAEDDTIDCLISLYATMAVVAATLDAELSTFNTICDDALLLSDCMPHNDF